MLDALELIATLGGWLMSAIEWIGSFFEVADALTSKTPDDDSPKE